MVAWNEILKTDHETIERVIAALDKALGEQAGPQPGVLRQAVEFFTTYADGCHNAKEEKHVFPLMEQRGIPRQGGPLAVMLMEHEKARELLKSWTAAAEKFLAGDHAALATLREAFRAYGALLKDHYWKENDILYPMALKVMTEDDNGAVLRGIEAVEASFGPDTRQVYYRRADEIVRGAALEDLSYGLSREVLAAILNTLPVEISFVDAHDRVRYFSHENKPKIFARSRGAIGVHVENCHPPKSLHMVRAILDDFKAGKREVAEFWIDLGPRKIHIRYFPVRDAAGTYLGCLEVVQDITGIQKLEGQKRLLDPA